MQEQDDLEAQDDFTAKRIVYAIPAMEDAVVQKDITYKIADDREKKLDVYYPPDYEGEARLPAVLFVHGDGPPDFLRDAKDWGCYESWGQLVAASGLIAVTFNHRSTEALTRLYEAAGDIDDLISYVRDHAGTLGIDPDILAIWTCSAGSPLGFRAALRNAPPYVRCVVSYYGISDLRVYYQEPADSEEDTATTDEVKLTLPTFPDEVFEEFSATAYIHKWSGRTIPLFITRAGLDTPELNASIDRLISTAIANNWDIDVMNHSTGHHGFDILDDNQRSREIIRTTLDFMKTHLNP
jgi:dipeptidyl aminopeptidase/acylaminoacyl peptidase